MARLAALALFLLPRAALAEVPAGTYDFPTKTDVPEVTRDGAKVPRCAAKEEHPIVRGDLIVTLHTGKVFVNSVMWRHLETADQITAQHGSAKDGLWIDLAFWRDKQMARGHIYVWHFDKARKVRCVDARSLYGTFKP